MQKASSAVVVHTAEVSGKGYDAGLRLYHYGPQGYISKNLKKYLTIIANSLHWCCIISFTSPTGPGHSPTDWGHSLCLSQALIPQKSFTPTRLAYLYLALIMNNQASNLCRRRFCIDFVCAWGIMRRNTRRLRRNPVSICKGAIPLSAGIGIVRMGTSPISIGINIFTALLG